MAEADTLEAIRQLSAQIEDLKRSLGPREEDRVREKAFDQLYTELKQYKEEFVFQAEKPLLLDLLLFHDSLIWFHESLVKQEMSPDVIADSFQFLIDEFLEVLYRRDVMPVEPSESFDRRIHKVVKIAETDDPGQDNRIVQVLKRGFGRSDKVLRPEEVVISRLGRDPGNRER